MSTLTDASEAEQRANLLGNDGIQDEDDEDQSQASVNNHEASVSVWYLLILTCGVAG